MAVGEWRHTLARLPSPPSKSGSVAGTPTDSSSACQCSATTTGTVARVGSGSCDYMIIFLVDLVVVFFIVMADGGGMARGGGGQTTVGGWCFFFSPRTFS